LKFDASTFHYKPRRTGQAAVEHRINDISENDVDLGLLPFRKFLNNGFIEAFNNTLRSENLKMYRHCSSPNSAATATSSAIRARKKREGCRRHYALLP